jgi:GAF domain-containing protein
MRELHSDRLKVVTIHGYEGESADAVNQKISLLGRGGLAGWVATHRQSALIRDVRQDERWDPSPHIGQWVRSALSVPLIHRDELIGVLVCSSAQEGYFTAEHLQLAQSAAAILAAAMANARLYAETQQRAKEIETLNQIGQELAATLRLDEIIEILGSQAGYLLRPGNLAIDLYDPTRNEIEVRLYLDRGERKPGFRFPLGEGLVSHIITTREPILTANYLDECQKRGITPRGEPAKAWLGVPLVAGEQVQGAILVWDYEYEASLDERDLRVLSMLAAQAAIAIKNARLYSELQNALAVQSQLFEASAKIASQLDTDTVLSNIVAHTREAVQADQCNVMLIDAQGYCYRWLGTGYSQKLEPHLMRPEGLSMRVMHSEQAIFIDDVTATEDINPRMRAEGIRASACLPLRSKTGSLGVMWVHFFAPHPFSLAEQTTLQTFANHAAVAVEQAYLFEETQHRLAELEAMSRISIALRAAEKLDAILSIFLSETLAVIGAMGGTIWLYDPVDDVLRQTVNRGLPEIPFPLEPGEGIAGQVFLTGEPHISHHFKSDPQGNESIRALLPADLGGAAIPLRTTKGVVGVLFVGVQLPRQLTPNEVRLLTTLAEIAGNAIQRTQLHEQTEQRLQRLTALHRIDSVITSSIDLPFTLDVLLDVVTTQLHVDAADILLYNPPTQTLEYAAGRGFRSNLFQQTRLQVGEGHAGRAALERQIIMIPNLRADPGAMARAQWLAGEDFLTYHGVPLIAKGQVKGVLETFHRTSFKPTSEWIDFLKTLGQQTAIAIDNAELFASLQRSNVDLTRAYDSTIEGWSRALDLRDKETEGHTQRVTELTLHLARAIGISEIELVHIRHGALLHDIGKMGIPDSILLKAGPLTDAEWQVMRKHPAYAYELLSPIAYLHSALDIPYCHHERWDGTGYPRGLKGEEIPLAARIFAVVDIWDALRSDRPYRAAWSEEQVREYIQSLAGMHLDPQVVEAFLKLEGKYDS